MFIRQNIQTLRFFRTTPAMRCPYLPHRLETKLVTELSGPDAISQHDTLTDAGFRRSHHFVYKPLCEGCRACVPVRIRVRDFEPSRAQKRILRRNEHVHALETQALATGEQYSLFSRYVMARHRDGDMADMDFDDYRAMTEESPVDTHLVEFRDGGPAGRLVENPRAVSYENDARYAPAVRPVSAYAPVDPRGPSELLTGRGLY